MSAKSTFDTWIEQFEANQNRREQSLVCARAREVAALWRDVYGTEPDMNAIAVDPTGVALQILDAVKDGQESRRKRDRKIRGVDEAVLLPRRSR